MAMGDAATTIANGGQNRTTKDASAEPRLPLELILRILWQAAQATTTTQAARDVCLVSHAAHHHCWPSLWRIVALRDAKQLKTFSELICPPHASTLSQRADDDGTDKEERIYAARRELRLRQDAVRCLYYNNNKDAAGLRALDSDERPEMWMMSIILAARNIDILHAEEYWSMSYPWESQEEKPLVAYPLQMLAKPTQAMRMAMNAAPDAAWSQSIMSAPDSGRDPPGSEEREVEAVCEHIRRIDSVRRDGQQCSPSRMLPQPREMTLSALAMTANHLMHMMNVSALTIHTPDDPVMLRKGAFARLTHLHLNFAKLDDALLDALQALPALTHLRLSRPFSELLADGVESMLRCSRVRGDRSSSPGLHRIIVEAGIYMDEITVQNMRKLAQSSLGRGRLHFVANARFIAPVGGTRAALQHAENRRRDNDGSGSGTNLSRIIKAVTNSEEQGFRDFVARAHCHAGVWEPHPSGR